MPNPEAKNESFEFVIQNADYDVIVELAAQHRSKKNDFSFCDQLKSLNEDELVSLMKQLLKILIAYIEKNLGQSVAVDWTNLSPEQCKILGHFIQATTDIGLACIQSDLTSKCRVELLEIALFLHGIMPAMPVDMDQVKNFIAHYCEKLFLTDLFDNGECFLNNNVLYLARKTLVKRAAKADVKRLYAIRKVLSRLTKENEPNRDQLWSLLLGCTVSATFLSILEGQKLIAYIMTLDSSKLLIIHEKIKNYVAGVSVKTAISYGKVYFEGWCYTVKSEDDTIQNTYELKVLQDLIIESIEFRRKHLMPIIRKVLNHFFIHKKDAEVSKLLYGVFQPLVWRYIKSHNGLYRACATQLFLDIFPLEDPEKRVVKNDMEVNEQLLMIKDLLLDEFPIVRISTVLGICLSMSVNWEVFPEEILKTFFRIIVNDLSRDSASSEIRLAVVKGIRSLLENPLTMRCLVAILPKLAGLFHDTAENVRLAFCQMLLKVKKISAIKYFDIVPVPHLLARLEEDSHSVKKCISNLLHNSYFPKDQDGKVWLGRCLELMKSDKYAAREFFSNVYNFIGLDISVKFMMQAGKVVHCYVRAKSSSSRLDLEISDKENIHNYAEYVSSLEDAVGFHNHNIVCCVMEAIAILWLSLKLNSNDLEENKKYLKMLVEKLSEPLRDLCIYYKDTEAWESVFYVSSFLPPKNIQTLGSLCFMRLKTLPPDAKESDYLTLLECLANQFQNREVLNLLKEWFEVGLSNSYVPPPPAKKRRSKKKSIEAVYLDQPKPYLANRILNTLLNYRSLQKRILKEGPILQEIISFIDIIQKKLERMGARLMKDAEADFLDNLIFSILRLSVHLHNYPNYDQNTSVPFLNDFVKWTSETLVPQLNPIDDVQSNLTILSLKICEKLCKVLGDVTTLGFFEANDCLYINFVYQLLDTDFAHEFIFVASKFLYKHAASAQYMILMDDDTTMMQHHLDYLNKIFALLNNDFILEQLSDVEFRESTFALANVMQVIHNHVNKLTDLSSQVFKTILKNILDCAAVKCVDIVQKMDEDPFDRLSFPKVSNFFWSIISLKPSLAGTYVKYLIDTFKDSQDIGISMWIAYWMIVWNFLQSKNSTQPVLREIQLLVIQLDKCLCSIYPPEKDFDLETEEEEPSESDPLKLFQSHCHAELIKLKTRLKSKLRNSMPPKKK